MLTVVTPATSTALTTLARARAVLGFAAASDAAAGIFIGQASDAIANHCRRVFPVEAVRETFADGDLRGGGPILARDPVIEISRVMNGSEIVASTGYRHDPSTGRLWRLDAEGNVLPWWAGSLAVEYRAGFVLPSDVAGAPAATLPAPVERAAILLVATYLSMRNRDVTVKSESVEGLGTTSWWTPGPGDALASPEAEQLLVPYVRFYP